MVYRILLVLLLTGCAGGGEYFRDAGPAPADDPRPLQAWPHREAWAGVVFNGEKIGFTRRVVRPVPDAAGLFEIEAQAVLRLQFLGIDKRINLRSLDRVRPDLTLESFVYEHEIDGSRLTATGRADARSVQFQVEANGSREDRKIALHRPLYPSSALALLPAVRGLAVGRNAVYSVFHGETQKVADAEVDIVAWESSELFEGPAFRLSTRMLGLETTTWISADGQPVFELAMKGVLISALEDEASARRYLVEASLNKRDALVDYSLVRSIPIEAPRRVSRLDLVLEGLPEGFVIPRDGGQACNQGKCSVDRSLPLAQGDPAGYLKATLAAPSNLGEIVNLARSIAGTSGRAEEKIGRLIGWMDANIAKEAVDSFTALDVLRERRAECQGHAYLLAALARALGIPVKIVNGLVYSEAHGGFLYHTWNETWIEGRGWLPVDATFGQSHADATHLKLLEGESPADLLPLVGLVGRLRIPSVTVRERWR